MGYPYYRCVRLGVVVVCGIVGLGIVFLEVCISRFGLDLGSSQRKPPNTVRAPHNIQYSFK